MYFHFTAEDYSAGADLPTTNPGYNFCQTGCGGGGSTGIVRATIACPEGTKYWEWITVDSQDSAYTEIQYQTSFPLSLTSGNWYYIAYYKRFERINGQTIWGNGQADKGIEIRGTGTRWVVSRGCNWGDIVNVPATKYTVWIGNPAYHLNLEIEGSSDEIPLNQGGYTTTNPIIMNCEQWYSIVFGFKAATEAQHNGEIKLWVNGTLVADYANICTVGDSNSTVSYLECGGTIAQPGYDAPAHKRQFDDLMFTDTWQDIVDGGYLSDPEGGSASVSPSGSLGYSGKATARKGYMKRNVWVT